jgi:uncharacterized protein DUF2849
VKILTGNDLKTGAVIWWDGNGWSLHVDDAVDASEHADEILAREEAARHVNSSYVVDAEQTPDGVRPGHIKERIRALGPTVRPDLTLKPADPAALNWVI